MGTDLSTLVSMWLDSVSVCAVVSRVLRALRMLTIVEREHNASKNKDFGQNFGVECALWWVCCYISSPGSDGHINLVRVPSLASLGLLALAICLSYYK